MSKKSWPNLYSELPNELGQDYFDKQYYRFSSLNFLQSWIVDPKILKSQSGSGSNI